MKINIKNISLSAMAILAFASCSDVVDYSVPDRTSNSGAPAISQIYDVQDTGYVAPLNGGVLNQMIHIKGQNLANAKKIRFNDVDVDVRQVYATTDEAWVKIPRVIPGVQNDILLYETDKGTTEINFPVSIPSVEISGLKNEFALQGNQVQINSEYMDLYGFNDSTETSPAKVYIENVDAGYRKEIHCDSCSEKFTSIVIPEDCPDNSLIHFSWHEISGDKTATLPYRMTDQLMFGDFTGDLGWWNDWGKGLVTDGTKSGDPESLGFSFLRVKGTYDAWSWNSTGFGCNWRWLDASAHPENYVLKFEVATNSSNPFNNYGDNGASGSKNGGYNLTLQAGGEGRCQFDPVSMGINNTYGKWITVSIPLTDVLKGGSLPTEADQYIALEFVMQPNTADAWNVDHCFGQFRIEPKKY
ncbi:glycan-binding surface protein [Segatella sp.]|uniref:glycan-binding surface protein n=1 Tax=Segatella sp. TaxID=2974253 RepID=UPI00307E7109